MEITFDSADPRALAGFWSELAGDGVVELTFVLNDAPKIEKNPIHLDLASSSAQDQAAIVERAEKLGAVRADIGQGDVPWVVLRDPEGNEFCVLEPRPEYMDTGSVAAVVCDVPDALAAAEATGLPVVRSGDGFASVRPGPGPWLEFLSSNDPDPLTERVRVRW